MLDFDSLMRYWSGPQISVNLLVFANIFGALVLGMLVGYERSYHGRAAGMRTYGLVCMSACALTVISGYPQFWFAGQELGNFATRLVPDPTRVIQGIVTGIGFLGAGVIMRDGLSITGLTTAASLWASSVIGIMVGVGFYSASILLAVLSGTLMMWAAKIERVLPSRPAIGVTLKFQHGHQPRREAINAMMLERGYQVAGGSFAVRHTAGHYVWRYIALELAQGRGMPITTLAKEMAEFEGIEEVDIGHARN